MSESTRSAAMVSVRTSGEPSNHALLTMYAVTGDECRASGCAHWSFNSESVTRPCEDGHVSRRLNQQSEFH